MPRPSTKARPRPFMSPGGQQDAGRGALNVHPTMIVLIARDPLAPETESFYRTALEALRDAEVPFLLGGAFALEHYTAITRNTHDIDAFVREADAARALETLAHAGYATDLKFPHWLGKAYSGGDELDVIYSSGNGVARVDDIWFEHAEDGV